MPMEYTFSVDLPAAKSSPKMKFVTIAPAAMRTSNNYKRRGRGTRYYLGSAPASSLAAPAPSFTSVTDVIMSLKATANGSEIEFVKKDVELLGKCSLADGTADDDCSDSFDVLGIDWSALESACSRSSCDGLSVHPDDLDRDIEDNQAGSELDCFLGLTEPASFDSHKTPIKHDGTNDDRHARAPKLSF